MQLLVLSEKETFASGCGRAGLWGERGFPYLRFLSRVASSELRFQLPLPATSPADAAVTGISEVDFPCNEKQRTEGCYRCAQRQAQVPESGNGSSHGRARQPASSDLRSARSSSALLLGLAGPLLYSATRPPPAQLSSSGSPPAEDPGDRPLPFNLRQQRENFPAGGNGNIATAASCGLSIVTSLAQLKGMGSLCAISTKGSGVLGSWLSR